MTEPSTSHVELEIQRRIQAQRVKVQAAKEQRAGLAAARRAGLAHRHAAKLRALAEAEERRQAAEENDGQGDEQQAEGGAACVTATDNGEEAFGDRVRYGYR
jgi:hypothetical protein